MRRIRRALWSALAVLAAVPAILVDAPSNGVAQDHPRPVAGGWATGGTLAPSEIMIELRRVGFQPISRPLQRGPVYVLFALDNGGVDVKLTVDARSGRVLWVSDAVVAPSRGYYGYPAWPRYGRPVPPTDITNIGPGGNNFGPDSATTSVRRSLPLPRARPADLTSAVNNEIAPPAAPSPAGGGDKAAGSAPAAPRAPTMVPVAPLE